MDYRKLLSDVPELTEEQSEALYGLLQQAEAYGRANVSQDLVDAINELHGDSAIDEILTKAQQIRSNKNG